MIKMFFSGIMPNDSGIYFKIPNIHKKKVISSKQLRKKMNFFLQGLGNISKIYTNHLESIDFMRPSTDYIDGTIKNRLFNTWL